MEADTITLTGFALSLLVAFLLSLFHVSLSSSSKITARRFLEDRERGFRQKILEVYDELKVSVDCLRTVILIALVVYVTLVFPRLLSRPLWFFLAAAAGYVLFLDLLPRLVFGLNRKKVFNLFLPSHRIFIILTKPLILLVPVKSAEKEVEEPHETTEEEIQALIDEAKVEGIIEKEEGALLQSVVEFGDTVVREIMTPRVSMACIRKEANIKKLRELVIKEKHSRIPVYKDRIDNIEGIVVAKDLLEFSADSSQDESIEPLIREVYFVPESMKVSELLKELQSRKQKMAVVVDEHGGVSGLVTMEDLMEEIVGEIQDEYDRDLPPVIEQGPSDFTVRGAMDVEELEDIFDTELSEDAYLTVSGLVTHFLGRLPKVGERFQIKGLEFEVLEVDQKRIKKIRVHGGKNQPDRGEA